jgi:hypothetical protein
MIASHFGIVASTDEHHNAVNAFLARRSEKPLKS